MLAPFASLALLPVAIALLAVPAPEAQTYPVGYDVLAETRSLDHGQRLRAALEVARWRSGRYPESLAALRELSPELLARVPLDEYSYARTAGGYALDRRYSSGRYSPGRSLDRAEPSGSVPSPEPGDGTLALSASAQPSQPTGESTPSESTGGETAAPSQPSVP
jgi:hypothetical protein